LWAGILKKPSGGRWARSERGKGIKAQVRKERERTGGVLTSKQKDDGGRNLSKKKKQADWGEGGKVRSNKEGKLRMGQSSDWGEGKEKNNGLSEKSLAEKNLTQKGT